MRNKSNNASNKAAAAANLANNQVIVNPVAATTNLEEINMIINAQTLQQASQQQQQVLNQNLENSTFQHHYAGQPVSLVKEGQKKSQAQIMLATASGLEHGASNSNINRKHSPFRRNQLQKPNQSALAAKQMQAQMGITAQNPHQQWMNQTMPVSINQVEHGGSGGSGGSGSQEQINQHLHHQMQKKTQQQQQRIQQQANQIANMKNVMLIDQMYQLQQNPPQPGKQVRARSNMQQPPGMGGQMAHNQYLAQKNFLANVNSEMQIQTMPSGIKKGSYISQKRKQISKDQGNFETVQDGSFLQTQSSKLRIHPTQGQASGQTNSQNLRISNHHQTISHTKKNSNATTSSTLQTKKGQHERNATIDKHTYKNEQQLLDQHLMQQNMMLMNHQQMGNYRNAGSTMQAFNNGQGKGSRQGSKLRKNISNMRGGAQTQLKNAQRVSQQRRFNNTTLENYQPIASNQLNTLQAVAPALKNNNLTIQQQSSLVPGQHYVHHHNTSSKYEQQMANNNQTASNLLKATGGQGMMQVQGVPGGPGHSRSVIRQNQQQKQYMNNFLAPNKYNSTHITGQGHQGQTDFSNQMRINNQMIVNKNEPRSKSNLKAPYNQTFGGQMGQFMVPQNNENNQNAQFNNYLSQQNYFDNSKVNGQSPLLKKNHAGGHKKSESVTHQRPPEQIHAPNKGHSNSIEPNPNGHHKNTYSTISQINTGNTAILQNISNPNVNLYQQYNNYKGKNTVESIAQEAKNSIQTSIKVKKCDSELSNVTAGHNKLSGDNGLGGRTSSNDQEGNMHHTGGIQQLRRNQPHNFSNISEKSSIMGDYGGTHTTHNSNQAKKSRQGMGGGIMGIMGSTQQVQAEHQQFFNNRNGSASHVGGGNSNKAGGNTSSGNNSTHNTSNPTHGGKIDEQNSANSKVNILSIHKNKAINKQFMQGHNGSNPPSALPSGSNLSNAADQPEGSHSIKGGQRGGNVPGSAGRQNSGQQQRHSRNASSKYQTQVVNMPGINNNKRIVIGQKHMQAHIMEAQQQMMLQTDGVNQGKLPNANQMTAFQALQNQQQMQQHLQQLQKQQPQLKNVLRSGPRNNEPQNQVPQGQKKGANKFRKNNAQQNTQQAAQPNRLVSKAQHAAPNHQIMMPNQIDNRVPGGMQPHGHVGVHGNVDFGLVVDPMTMQGVIQDTLEQVPSASQYDGPNNRSGARRLSMPVPYQQMHTTMQGMEKDQQLQGHGHAGKMLQAKLEVGHGLRAGGVPPNNHAVAPNGNTGALDSGTKNHLYSEDHENYDFDDEDINDGGHALDQNTVDRRTGAGQANMHKQAPGGTGKSQAVTKTVAKAGKPEVQILKQPAPTQQQRVIINANAPQQTIGAQDQILIKDNNVYLRNPSDDLADKTHLGRLVPATGQGANQNLRHMLQTGDTANVDIRIQDDSQNKQQKGAAGKAEAARTRGAKEGDENKVINYETFESSSEDEYSCGAFESAAASFQNKEKQDEANNSGVQDQKRLERQRRKERKALEKKKQKEEQDRQGRNNIRRKYRIQSVGIEQYDQYQEDILNFKDSDRESLISYFENNSDLGKSRAGLMLDDNFFYRENALDTPTRLLNHSNEFLPKKKKINADKLATRAKQDEQLMKNIKNFQDIEQMSNLEKSQKSTMRKAEDEKKDMLFKIVSKSDMDKLRTTLRSQLAHEK